MEVFISDSGTLNIKKANPQIATNFLGDSGEAIPISNALNILGENGITTTGAGNTVTIGISGLEQPSKIVVDYSLPPGTNPIEQDVDNLITITGAQVQNGTVGANVIRSASLEASKMTLQIQRSATASFADIDKNGVAHFDSASFQVDSNGFVKLYSANSNYTNVTAGMSPYTVVGSDNFISCDTTDGAITIKLPDSPTFKRGFVIKDRLGLAGINNISITTVSGIVTIDGSTTYVINANYQAVNILANLTPTYEIY